MIISLKTKANTFFVKSWGNEGKKNPYNQVAVINILHSSLKQ